MSRRRVLILDDLAHITHIRRLDEQKALEDYLLGVDLNPNPNGCSRCRFTGRVRMGNNWQKCQCQYPSNPNKGRRISKRRKHK